MSSNFNAIFAPLLPSILLCSNLALLLETKAISDSAKKPFTKIKLHLKGTPFQLKVWEALLKIPMGARSTYGQLAHEIGQPTASRAVGTAIGSNPIAFIIPCHRVIQASGHLGGYMWGPIRKAALLGWENAAVANDALQNNDKK